MKAIWAVCLPREAAAALAPLRLIPGLETAIDPDGRHVWLRGPKLEGHPERLVCGLPATDRFEWLEDGQLRRVDLRIPSARLPALAWRSLEAEVEPVLPVSRPALPAPTPVSLRLVRTTAEQPAGLLETTFAAWASFAANAPEIRLRPLQFAVAADRRTLVRGRPMPPLPGRQFVLLGNLAVPAGFAWQPAVSVAVLARRLGVPEEAVAILHEDGTFTRIEAEQFVAATRPAVRATAAIQPAHEP